MHVRIGDSKEIQKQPQQDVSSPPDPLPLGDERAAMLDKAADKCDYKQMTPTSSALAKPHSKLTKRTSLVPANQISTQA